MDYSQIRRDMISAYLLRFLLERNKVLMPNPDDAAKSAVRYANALIHNLDLEKDDREKQRKEIFRNIVLRSSKTSQNSKH